MTTLEKVAKVLCNSCRGIDWKNYLPEARAAIEALRNSPALEQAWQKMESKTDNWNNALDAILNEK
jgi:hypothetical protein